VTEATEDTGFWAILEIMGHKRYAGRVSEHELGGSSFVRIDVPAHGDQEAFSKMFGPQAIYCVTPVSEQAARAAASQLDEKPMTVWSLPEEWQAAINQQRLSLGHNEFSDDDFRS